MRACFPAQSQGATESDPGAFAQTTALWNKETKWYSWIFMVV